MDVDLKGLREDMGFRGLAVNTRRQRRAAFIRVEVRMRQSRVIRVIGVVCVMIPSCTHTSSCSGPELPSCHLANSIGKDQEGVSGQSSLTLLVASFEGINGPVT